MKSGIFTIFVLSSFLAFSMVYAGTRVNEEAVKELKCPNNLPSPVLNSTWFSEVKTWYIPYWSKLEAYRTFGDMLDKKAGDLTEEEIENSCIQMDKNFTMTAFNTSMDRGVGDKVKVTWDDDAHVNFHWTDEHGTKGSYHMVMTDNETFVLGVSCYDDEESSWDILTTIPKLDPKTLKKALDFVTSLGYRENNFVVNNYDHCYVGH